MTRRNYLSMLPAALIAIAVLLFIAPEPAQAQQNLNCCSYSVEITGITPECFPIRIKTQWDGGFNDIIDYFANGVYWKPIPAPCPPAPKFQWVSLNLGVTQVRLGETKKFMAGPCCYKVTATLNPNFCILILISPC